MILLVRMFISAAGKKCRKLNTQEKQKPDLIQETISQHVQPSKKGFHRRASPVPRIV